jgi:alkylation response protein AidB-like acyl-CoA dehydrogenase
LLGPAGRFGAWYDGGHDWARARLLLDLPDVRAALAEAKATMRVNELLNWQVASADAAAPVDVADASATKVFSSERIQRLCALLEEAVARNADLSDPGTAELVEWLDIQAKRNLVLTFGGGVNEIQRELIGKGVRFYI